MNQKLLLICLLCASPFASAGIKVQITLPSIEGAKIENLAPNSEDHAYPYMQTNLNLRADSEALGQSDFIDSAAPKNNTQQDKLRHFSILVTGQAKINALDASLKECLAGAQQMKSARGTTKVSIVAEVDEMLSGTYGGIVISGSGAEGDTRSQVKIDRLDQGRKYASVTLLNPKMLSCKFSNAK